MEWKQEAGLLESRRKLQQERAKGLKRERELEQAQFVLLDLFQQVQPKTKEGNPGERIYTGTRPRSEDGR